MNAEEQSSPDLLTPREACDRLRVSKSTLDRWVREGVLNTVRLGTGTRRFKTADLDTLIRQGVDAPSFSLKGARA
jgi:excisionase family DNA binding protein